MQLSSHHLLPPIPPLLLSTNMIQDDIYNHNDENSNSNRSTKNTRGKEKEKEKQNKKPHPSCYSQMALASAPSSSSSSALEETYHSYIAALNQRPFPGLTKHMHSTVILNETPMALAEFEKLLTDDIDAAPDLRFAVHWLLVDQPRQRVGSRIEFRCTPRQEQFMGRDVHGSGLQGIKVKCAEHMFYQYREGKIATVWWMPAELVAVGEEDG